MTTIDLAHAGVYYGQIMGEQRRKAVVGLQVAAHLLVGTIQTRIIPTRDPVPVDRGIYRAGWKVENTPDGANIYNDSPIAALIEWGVRASHIKIGFKLINALAQWCIRKGLVGGKDKKASAIRKAKATVKTIAAGTAQPPQTKQPKQPKTPKTPEEKSDTAAKNAASRITKSRAIAWAIAIKMRRGKGIHNQFPGGGLRIMEEMNARYTKSYVQVCVTRELQR